MPEVEAGLKLGANGASMRVWAESVGPNALSTPSPFLERVRKTYSKLVAKPVLDHAAVLCVHPELRPAVRFWVITPDESLVRLVKVPVGVASIAVVDVAVSVGASANSMSV